MRVSVTHDAGNSAANADSLFIASPDNYLETVLILVNLVTYITRSEGATTGSNINRFENAGFASTIGTRDEVEPL